MPPSDSDDELNFAVTVPKTYTPLSPSCVLPPPKAVVTKRPPFQWTPPVTAVVAIASVRKRKQPGSDRSVLGTGLTGSSSDEGEQEHPSAAPSSPVATTTRPRRQSLWPGTGAAAVAPLEAEAGKDEAETEETQEAVYKYFPLDDEGDPVGHPKKPKPAETESGERRPCFWCVHSHNVGVEKIVNMRNMLANRTGHVKDAVLFEHVCQVQREVDADMAENGDPVAMDRQHMSDEERREELEHHHRHHTTTSLQMWTETTRGLRSLARMYSKVFMQCEAGKAEAMPNNQAVNGFLRVARMQAEYLKMRPSMQKQAAENDG